MANLYSIHSVSTSLMTYLRNAYPEPLRTQHHCAFSVLSSGELAKLDEPDTMVSFYAYRVAINEHMRNQRPVASATVSRPPLAVDIHFLLTIWAGSAVDEHLICGWVMSQLNLHPVLDASFLSADGGWRPDELVQIIPTELSIEDMMRIWDAFAPSYRLSLPYVARVVSIEPVEEGGALPVVATRFGYSDEEPRRG